MIINQGHRLAGCYSQHSQRHSFMQYYWIGCWRHSSDVGGGNRKRGGVRVWDSILWEMQRLTLLPSLYNYCCSVVYHSFNHSHIQIQFIQSCYVIRTKWGGGRLNDVFHCETIIQTYKDSTSLKTNVTLIWKRIWHPMYIIKVDLHLLALLPLW